jgi:hypothetical protein
MRNTGNDSASVAVELMTARAANPKGETTFLGEHLLAVIEERGHGDDVAAIIEIVLGFIALSGALVELRATEVGISEEDTLRELAVRFDGV